MWGSYYVGPLHIATVDQIWRNRSLEPKAQGQCLKLELKLLDSDTRKTVSHNLWLVAFVVNNAKYANYYVHDCRADFEIRVADWSILLFVYVLSYKQTCGIKNVLPIDDQ